MVKDYYYRRGRSEVRVPDRSNLKWCRQRLAIAATTSEMCRPGALSREDGPATYEEQ